MSLGLAFALLASLLAAGPGCARLAPPVDGEITAPYAPIGRYGGHWGADFAAPAGSRVSTAAAGTVTFAGSVAGRLSVTVAHGGGLRTSYSYLADIRVVRGQPLAQGALVATSGSAHGRSAVHFSVRIGDRYQDPEPWLHCAADPAPALRLSAVYGRSVYPRTRATRHPRWNLRPPSHGAPVRR